MEGLIRELGLQTYPLGAVAETPDPAHDLAVHELRSGETLEDPAVLEFEDVRRLVLGVGGEEFGDREECLGIDQLIEHGRDGLVVHGAVHLVIHEALGDLEHLAQTAVDTGDGAGLVDDEDTVSRRVEGGLQQRQGVAQFELHGSAGGDVVRRDDEPAHRRLVDEVHDRQFERQVLPFAAAQSHPDHHRVHGRGAVRRLSQCGRQGRPVRFAGQVGQRQVLDVLGVMAQHPGERGRHGIDVPALGHEHGDGRRVVDERAEAGRLVARHLETAALGEIAQAEEDRARSEPANRSPDELDQPPPRRALEPHLQRGPHLLGLDAGERSQDEFEVVGMDEFEPRTPGVLVEGVAEEALGARVAPEHLAHGVEHDHHIGQFVQQPGQGTIGGDDG